MGRFWRCYDALPKSIQSQADKQHSLFKRDPNHPSLQFKRIGLFWSVRVDSSYRALGIRRADTISWFWIGPHDEYEQIIYRQ